MRLEVVLVATVVAIGLAGDAAADPCGMVPPVYVGQGGASIKRVGPQKTYVFHKDGVEDIVLRPGYSGNVEEFGMLVPLPSVPALRKVPDEIFAQIAAAVDPPEIVIDLRPRYYEMEAPMAGVAADVAKNSLPSEDVVRVLKQEAVGMYEVAVLDAGSAKALEKWMTEHKFKYPTGMDDVTNDYVKARWCFVAVKTRIGPKAPTDPRPGMKGRPANPLPPGGSYDGYIQGMGFRFESKEAVVPMRLATYNDADDRRQIVYALTVDPVKFEGVPADRVVRQLPGERVRRNVTEPLPLRILGGQLEDVPKEQLEYVKPQRDPGPHNGRAKELFAGDLEAARTKVLALSHEEEEKELLNIGERLGLRGPEIDALHAAELARAQEELARRALGGLDGMTLSVIDGEFPLDYMRKNDLTFTRFEMPRSRNDPTSYDAVQMGPGYRKEGVRVEGEVDTRGPKPKPAGTPKKKSWYDTLWGN